MTFQGAKVRKPLLGVSGVIDKGNIVAQGSELTPNALEDDCGRVGIRAPVLQPHAAVPLPPLAPEVRQVRRAPLRRTDLEQF